LFKTFSTGVILGAVLAGTAAWFLPLHDIHRAPSQVVVLPNGGNAENFRIRLPEDRVVGAGNGVIEPAGVRWPASAMPADAQLELFKLRDVSDEVVGLASRISVTDSDGRQAIEWVLNLPARGSLYVPMEILPTEDGSRIGRLRSGSFEFAGRSGSLVERYVTGVNDVDGGSTGRIELSTQLVAQAVSTEDAS